jgi:GDP-4-dehydro-6-deoxy-D-mannose reductase
MRVLVTGAAGFVGRHLVRALARRGDEVFAGALEGAPLPGADAELAAARWLPMDVTDTPSLTAAVARARPDAVVHLAAQSSVGASFGDALGTWEANATGTLRLLHAVGPATRVLFVSSAEVYGPVPPAEQPIREDRPLRPTNPYAASKAAAEMAAVHAALGGVADAVIARSFNHTGPGQDERFVLPAFARQLAAAADGDGVLRVGNLEVRRDFLDVRDVVRAYLLLLDRGARGEAYNVASGQAVSLREVLDEMIALRGVPVRVEVDPARVRPADVPVLCGDPSRLAALGWAREIPLRDTLADLLDHAAAHA